MEKCVYGFMNCVAEILQAIDGESRVIARAFTVLDQDIRSSPLNIKHQDHGVSEQGIIATSNEDPGVSDPGIRSSFIYIESQEEIKSSLRKEIACYKEYCDIEMFDGTLFDSNYDKKMAYELLDAAKDGRGDDVVRLLTDDPKLIRIGDLRGDTALHSAIRVGHWDVALNMIKFLSRNHKVLLCQVLNQVNAHEETPDILLSKRKFDLLSQRLITNLDVLVELTELDNVAEHELEDAVHDMIDKIKLNYGCGLAHIMVINNHVDNLKKMIENSQNYDWVAIKLLLLEKNKIGNTPLHLAVYWGHEEVTRYLVEAVPCAIYQVNKQGSSPLFIAFKKGDVDLVRYMIITHYERMSLTERILLLEHAVRVSLAHVAIEFRNLAMLKAVMEGLPNLINSRNRLGWTPLSYAASKGYVDEVSYFLEYFPTSARLQDNDGSFPVHKAVVGGNKGIVEKFLLHCPEALYDVDMKGRSVIDIAAKYARDDILVYLTKKSRDVMKGTQKSEKN